MIDTNDIQHRLQQLQELDEAELRNFQKELADQIKQKEKSLCQDLKNMNKQLLERQAAVRESVSAKSTLRKAVRNHKRSKVWNTILRKISHQKDTKEREDKLKELERIRQKKCEDEKNKKNKATDFLDKPVPNWRQQIQQVTKSVLYAQELESKLTKSALRTRTNLDRKWLASVVKKATQGGNAMLRTSALTTLVSFIIVLARETLYYKYFEFDIVPYLLDSSILPASAATTIQTILVFLPITFGLLLTVLFLPAWFIFPLQGIRSYFVFLRWKSAKTETGGKIERQLQSSTTYLKDLKQNRVLDRSHPSVSHTDTLSKISLHDPWRKLQDSFNRCRKRIEAEFEKTFRSFCLISAFSLGLLLMWGEVRYQANEVLDGNTKIGILTEPPLKSGANVARIGGWGNYLFLAQPSESNQTNVALPKANSKGWWNHTSRAIINRWKFLCSGLKLKDRDNSLNVQVISRSSIVCIAPTEKFSSICAAFSRKSPVILVVSKNQSSKELAYYFAPTLQWQENTLIVRGLEPEQRVIEELRNKAKCMDSQPLVSPAILFEKNNGGDVLDQKSLNTFLDQFTEGDVVRLVVFGLASPDGDEGHNQCLSNLRAETVLELIRKKLDRDVNIEIEGLGEEHLTHGIANSRSVRVVACLKIKGLSDGAPSNPQILTFGPDPNRLETHPKKGETGDVVE